ncbi:MAG: TonB-dependent receptor [Sphingomonadaceae bacterium]
MADDGIEVIASLDDPAGDTVAPQRSLGKEALAANAPVSALDNLSLLPGIDAFEKGGIGGGSYLSVRGGEPNFTLVTINGVRVNDPMQSSGGGFDFSLLAPGDLERIDVLQGPHSTAYGADALSGVVSVRLAQPEEGTHARFRAGMGSGERYDLGGSVSLGGKAGSLLVAASASDTNDFLAGSENERQSVMLAASPALGAGFSLDLFGFYSDASGRGFAEDSGGPLLAVIPAFESREREQLALGGAFAAQLSEAVTAQLRAGWSRNDLATDNPGIAPGVLDGIPPLVTDSRFERFEVVGSLSAQASRELGVTLGASLVEEDGRSTGTLDFGFPIPTDYRQSRALPGLFAGADLLLDSGLQLRGGLRVDFPDQGKARWTPRLGARMPLGETGLAVRTSWAQGFKQPSLFALGFPLLANPDLLPERSRTLDAGLEWRSPDGAWRADVTGFRSVYRDLIDFEPELFTNVNRSRVTARGIEAALRGGTGPLRLTGALTYMKTRSADGAPLRFRPEWTGRLAADWQVAETLALRLDGQFNDGFLDSSVPTGFVRLGGFETLDAQVIWQALPGIELRAALRNLTNSDYARTIGTPEPGRNVFISLQAAL